MALLVVKYYTSMLRQIQDICNLSFVLFDIFLTRGIVVTTPCSQVTKLGQKVKQIIEKCCILFNSKNFFR